ncbi:hypothetical protein CSUI_006270 [Cystoisospora suis]|uniref:Uncharacterized protein n=1 Tax=Cystoisospora suis TaxID=483139 RepID=A0A2C6KHC7_9APIC|nr:hypothetical protein CSUI_006270 [Cystoisospora suis]
MNYFSFSRKLSLLRLSLFLFLHLFFFFLLLPGIKARNQGLLSSCSPLPPFFFPSSPSCLSNEEERRRTRSCSLTVSPGKPPSSFSSSSSSSFSSFRFCPFSQKSSRSPGHSPLLFFLRSVSSSSSLHWRYVLENRLLPPLVGKGKRKERRFITSSSFSVLARQRYSPLLRRKHSHRYLTSFVTQSSASLFFPLSYSSSPCSPSSSPLFSSSFSSSSPSSSASSPSLSSSSPPSFLSSSSSGWCMYPRWLQGDWSLFFDFFPSLLLPPETEGKSPMKDNSPYTRLIDGAPTLPENVKAKNRYMEEEITQISPLTACTQDIQNKLKREGDRKDGEEERREERRETLCSVEEKYGYGAEEKKKSEKSRCEMDDVTVLNTYYSQQLSQRKPPSPYSPLLSSLLSSSSSSSPSPSSAFSSSPSPSSASSSSPFSSPFFPFHSSPPFHSSTALLKYSSGWLHLTDRQREGLLSLFPLLRSSKLSLLSEGEMAVNTNPSLHGRESSSFPGDNTSLHGDEETEQEEEKDKNEEEEEKNTQESAGSCTSLSFVSFNGEGEEDKQMSDVKKKRKKTTRLSLNHDAHVHSSSSLHRNRNQQESNQPPSSSSHALLSPSSLSSSLSSSSSLWSSSSSSCLMPLSWRFTPATRRLVLEFVSLPFLLILRLSCRLSWGSAMSSAALTQASMLSWMKWWSRSRDNRHESKERPNSPLFVSRDERTFTSKHSRDSPCRLFSSLNRRKDSLPERVLHKKKNEREKSPRELKKDGDVQDREDYDGESPVKERDWRQEGTEDDLLSSSLLSHALWHVAVRLQGGVRGEGTISVRSLLDELPEESFDDRQMIKQEKKGEGEEEEEERENQYKQRSERDEGESKGEEEEERNRTPAELSKEEGFTREYGRFHTKECRSGRRREEEEGIVYQGESKEEKEDEDGDTLDPLGTFYDVGYQREFYHRGLKALRQLLSLPPHLRLSSPLRNRHDGKKKRRHSVVLGKVYIHLRHPTESTSAIVRGRPKLSSLRGGLLRLKTGLEKHTFLEEVKLLHRQQVFFLLLGRQEDEEQRKREKEGDKEEEENALISSFSSCSAMRDQHDKGEDSKQIQGEEEVIGEGEDEVEEEKEEEQRDTTEGERERRGSEGVSRQEDEREKEVRDREERKQQEEEDEEERKKECLLLRSILYGGNTTIDVKALRAYLGIPLYSDDNLHLLNQIFFQREMKLQSFFRLIKRKARRSRRKQVDKKGKCTDTCLIPVTSVAINGKIVGWTLAFPSFRSFHKNEEERNEEEREDPAPLSVSSQEREGRQLTSLDENTERFVTGGQEKKKEEEKDQKVLQRLYRSEKNEKHVDVLGGRDEVLADFPFTTSSSSSPSSMTPPWNSQEKFEEERRRKQKQEIAEERRRALLAGILHWKVRRRLQRGEWDLIRAVYVHRSRLANFVMKKKDNDRTDEEQDENLVPVEERQI